MTNWVDEDELTITYGTLRKAMAESGEAERARIVALLEKAKGGRWLAHDDRALIEGMIALIRGENNV